MPSYPLLILRMKTRRVCSEFDLCVSSLLQKCRYQNLVKMTVVSCPTVVDITIVRPDLKFQLGFTIQDGVVNMLTMHAHNSVTCLVYQSSMCDFVQMLPHVCGALLLQNMAIRLNVGLILRKAMCKGGICYKYPVVKKRRGC